MRWLERYLADESPELQLSAEINEVLCDRDVDAG